MGIIYRLVLLLALFLCWLVFYLVFPAAREKDLQVYHLLVILGLVFVYLAASDPIRLTDALCQIKQTLMGK